MSCGVVRGLFFFLEIPFKLILATDINFQYLMDYKHEEEYTSFSLLFPLSFLYNMGRYPYIIFFHTATNKSSAFLRAGR